MHRSGLTELEAVLAVARLGSFRAAAVELGMSTSALSHAVAALEARLGVRLFNRTTRSVALSEAGARFVAEIAPAVGQIGAAMDTAQDSRQRPSGTLRLNMHSGALRLVGPLLHEYLRRYPEMRLDVVTEGRLIDIVAAGFDAGVRLAGQVPRDMVAVPIGGDVSMAVVGSPDYFARHAPPQTPAELAAHSCIRTRFSNGAIYRWEFQKNGESLALDVQGPLTLDDMSGARAAALAGVGLAFISVGFVSEALAAGRLVRVLADWTPPFPGIALYYPSQRHAAAGLRAFVELIREMNARA
ncbi:MAG: LysR family transcriptional regulator [Paucibacter sp.]|nr:LysR family transcriptional regulator [Roseateles sp.]